MRRVGVNYLMPGMRISRPVYGGNGELLFAAGLVLDKDLIRRLCSLGIGSVYIEDKIFTGEVGFSDVVSQKRRTESIKLIKKTFKNVEKERFIDATSVQRTADDLIDEIMVNNGALVNSCEIMTYDDYTFKHSVDVCILSILIGYALGYDRLKLKELAIGALLHDIGKIEISKDILNKPGSLSQDEMDEIRQHPEKGFAILRQQSDISLLAAYVALQHHERLDGSGYPRGLSGKEIQEYARIVMVADVFDALTTDRPYRPAYPVSQAIDIIESLADRCFEKEIVAALSSNISRFPSGSIVMLSTGEIGHVIKTDIDAPDKPFVKVVFDREKNQLNEPYEIKISDEPSISVTKSLTDEEVSELFKSTNKR